MLLFLCSLIFNNYFFHNLAGITNANTAQHASLYVHTECGVNNASVCTYIQYRCINHTTVCCPLYAV